MSTHTGVCNFCGTGCGHLLEAGDGAVRGVFASPGHPVSRGRLCVRGWHIHELLATRDRITAPAIRRGGRLEAVPYEEALAYAADRLARYSGDEIGFLASARASNEDNFLMAKLARTVFRTPHIALASDQGHGDAAEVLLEGAGMPAMTGALTEIRKAGLILVVGADIAKLNPIIGSEIHYAARGGAGLVTLSPRSSQIAKLSGTHLWSRPGTLRHALAATAKVLVERGWQDEAFLRDRTEGFTDFACYLSGLDLAALTAASGLAPADIEDLARRLSQARGALAFFSSGISGLDRASVALLFDLFLAAGQIGREGSGVNPVTGICNIVGSYRCRRLAPVPRRPHPGRGAGRRTHAAAAPRGVSVAAQGPGRGRPRRGDRPARGQDQGSRVPPLYRRLHQPLLRLRPRRPALGHLRRGRRDLHQRRAPHPAQPQEGRPARGRPSGLARLRRHRRPARRLLGLSPRPRASWPRSLRPFPPTPASPTPSSRRGIGLQWPCDARHPDGTVRLAAEDAGAQAPVRRRRRRLRRPGPDGGLSLPAHGRQGQLLLAPEQRHEEDP